MIALRLDSVKLVAVFPSRVGIGFGQFAFKKGFRTNFVTSKGTLV